MSTALTTLQKLAIAAALGIGSFTGLSAPLAGDAEARGFHGRGGGGRMMHGGGFRHHAVHHRLWRHHHRHHRWGWRVGAPLVIGAGVLAAECYVTRQRVWSDAYAAYVVRRVRICG